MDVSRYDCPPMSNLRIGEGAALHTGEILEELGLERVLLITTGSLVGTDTLAQVRERAGDRVVEAFANSRPHLPAGMTDDLLAVADGLQPDGVLTLGGGTVTDGGKAVAAGLATGARSASELYEYRICFTYPDVVEMTPMTGPFIPQVAIPTTLSAAEYDGVFGMTTDGVKDLYLDLGIVPDVVVLDPDVTRSTPRWLWASTGVRALDHAVETYLSSKPTAVTDACAVAAIKKLYAELPATLDDDGEAREERTSCLVAGWLSMIGVHNVFLGLSHGIGHQLGARCGVPHGQTSCIMLPVVLELMEERSPERMALLARNLGLVGEDASTGDAASALTRSVTEFISSLGVPMRLSEVGVGREMFHELAEEAMGDMAVASSPLEVDARTIVGLLERAS